MTVSHHLDDVTILAYAAGTLGEAHSIVASSHLAYCPKCRAAAREANVIGGDLLSALPVEAVSDICRSATLASLDAGPQARQIAAQVSPDNLPKPLFDAFGGRALKDLPWKKKAPGVAIADVPLSQGAKGMLKVLSIAPGLQMPEHGHGGEELTLVVKGAYTDKLGRFAPGDVADLDEDVEHAPVVDEGETCICIVAIEAPTKFKPLWARMMQPLIGI